MKANFVADTNIIVRLLVQDDDEQLNATVDAIESGTISMTVFSVVLIEVYWVLKSRYRLEKPTIVDGLQAFIASEGILLEEEDIMRNTLERFRSVNVDLVEVYIGEKAKSVHSPVLTWNAKDFGKLSVEHYTPSHINHPRG
jgi:predicted nucleic-acid-binding protein